MKPTSIKELKEGTTLSVMHAGQKYVIDISSELSINENIINTQLKDSPSSYAFLCMLRDKAIKAKDLLERQKDIAFSEAYIYYKDSGVANMTNEKANHKANTNQKYCSLYEQYIKASNTAAKLIGICKAFEGREKILQTLSANLRKER